VQEKAIQRGIDPVPDRSFDRDIDLQSVHDDYVRDWLDGEDGAIDDGRTAAEFILKNSGETNPPDGERITFDDIVEHPRRFKANGGHWTSPVEEDTAFAPWKNFVQEKHPWPTVTGRQQYYIDHDWFLEMDEALPTFKEPVLEEKADEYPLRYLTPHGRWSIHSTWRDDKYMLRLNRGEPVVYIHPDDAAKRDIEDGDQVVIKNDLAEIQVMAKIYPSSEQGAVRLNFSWEHYQFPGDGNFNSLTSMQLKPTQLVQYPEDSGEHLHFFPNFWGPTGVNSDERVAIEPVDGGENA
jgi:complex iron-sulfur molybdoenzyme family reductase subunit alpha